MKCELDNLIVIQIGDQADQMIFPLIVFFRIGGLGIAFHGGGVLEKLSQISFLEVERGKEFFSDERLRLSHVSPAVTAEALTLNSKELAIVHYAVWLSTGELEECPRCRVLRLVSIALVSNIFSVRLRWLQE